MQVGPIDSSRLAPLLLAGSMPSDLFPAPHMYRTLRLPSLAPRLPTLPSLKSTLAAQGTYPTSADFVSPSNTSSSISYILNPPAHQAAEVFHRVKQQPLFLSRSSSNVVSHPYGLAVRSVPRPMRLMPPYEGQTQPKKKRKTRICKSEGCEKYVVDRGLCIRHGGGKRCSVEGCNCRAQNRGLCWKHGGHTRCTVEGCTKRAKSRGICWSHGGGTRCKHSGCAKIAVSHGLCWAHGGGKRCLVDSCQKPAYERNGNLCAEHYAQRPTATCLLVPSTN